MTIQREPHPVFAGLWVAWLVNVYGAIFAPGHPLYGLLVILLFFPIEIPAAATKTRGNARDTISEIATWVQRKTSHHRLFMQGWNAALFVGLIVPVSYLLARTVWYYAGASFVSFGLGALIGAGCARFLWDHFVNPDVNG